MLYLEMLDLRHLFEMKQLPIIARQRGAPTAPDTRMRGAARSRPCARRAAVPDRAASAPPEGAADAVIGPMPEERDLHARPLYDEDGVMVVRRDHPRVKRKLTRELFGTLGHVDVHLSLGRGGVGNKAAVDAFARHGLVRHVAVTVPTFAAAAMVVGSTDLVTGMPRRLAERFAAMVPIRVVTSPLPAMTFRMQIFWHERTHRDPIAAAFRDVVASTFC